MCTAGASALHHREFAEVYIVESRTDAELAGRVQRLLQFLREIVRARTKPVLRVDQHEQVEWLHQDGRTIQLDPDAAQGDIVLRVPLIGVDDPPDLPTVLAGWVDAAGPRRQPRAPTSN